MRENEKMHSIQTPIKSPTEMNGGSWYKLSNNSTFFNQQLLASQQNNAELVDQEVASALQNGYDRRLPLDAAVGHYYCYSPSSDLETILEESSVLDSEDEISLRNRQDSHHHAENFAPYRDGRIRGSDSSFSSMSSSSTPRQSGSYSTHSSDSLPNGLTEDSRNCKPDDSVRSAKDQVVIATSNQLLQERFRNGFSAVDPFAQQRIVYAKCLTSHSTDDLRSGPEDTTAKDNGTSTNVMTGGNISDMFEAARIGDVSGLNTFSVSELGDTLDERGNTPLHIAAENGQLACVKRLVSVSTAELITLPNDDLMTPTAMAVKNDHIDCVQWLVRHTSARDELSISNRPSSFDGSTTRPPIAHVAARYNRSEILDWLCEEMDKEGFSVDTADHCSNTPVHVAARYGHLECIQTLVSRGASVTMLNSDGDTPGQAARKYDHGTCVGYLVVVETCVSLAQQLVALRSDVETLKAENQRLRASSDENSTQSSNVATSRKPEQGNDLFDLEKDQVYSKQNSFADVDGANEEKSQFRSVGSKPSASKHPPQNGTRRRKLEEQPPPPKIWNTFNAKTGLKPGGLSEVSRPSAAERAGRTLLRSESSLTHASMQEKINAALNGPGTSLDEVEVTSSQQIQEKSKTLNRSTALTRNNRKNSVSDEIANLTKDIHTSTPKKPWEKLSMDEMLKMVRDMRYQPSPSISLCTEDSTLETPEVMRERMAAASRWFLVERTRDKGASSRPAVAGNGANKKKFEPVATSTPRQRINVQPAVSWVASANGIHHVPHMNNGSHGATQRAQQQQALQQKIGNYYSRAARPTESGGEAGATSREKRINIDEKRGTLKFAVKDCKPDEQASQLAHDSQGTGLKSRKNSSAMSPTAKPANGATSNSSPFSAQRSGSYRRAVESKQAAAETRSSSDSLSSGSSPSTAKSKGASSDARSVGSAKSLRSSQTHSPLASSQNGGSTHTDPLQKRSAKEPAPVKRAANSQSENQTVASKASASAQLGFAAIERPPPTNSYRAPVQSVTVPNPNRMPYFWSVPRGYTAHAPRKPYPDPQEEREDSLQSASEVPQLRAEIPSRQSSFLRKVQGKLK